MGNNILFQFDSIHPLFFSESATSNNPYFVTGAGTMLQAVIYGFGGVEQSDYGFKYNKGLLPKQWKSLKRIDWN